MPVDVCRVVQPSAKVKDVEKELEKDARKENEKKRASRMLKEAKTLESRGIEVKANIMKDAKLQPRRGIMTFSD